MDIHMPDAVSNVANRARGNIDVPQVRDGSHFADAHAWAQAALDDAAVASAAERDHAINKSESDAHRNNLQDAAMVAVKEDILRQEANQGHEMTDPEIEAYAGGFLYASAGKFTTKESEALSTTWRGKVAQWIGSKGKIKQALMAAAVPAAITTGAAFTGVGALAGGAVAARYGWSRLKGASSANEKDTFKRWQAVAGNAETNQEGIANVVAAHDTDRRDVGVDDDARVEALAQNVVGLLTDSAEKLSHMDRRRARIGLGVAAGAAVAGGVMRFTDVNPFRDAVNAVGRRVFGVIEGIESPVEFHDAKMPVEFHDPSGGHVTDALEKIDSPVEFHDARVPVEFHNPVGRLDSPVEFHNDWPVETHNPFASEDVGGGSGAADSVADETTSGSGGPNIDESPSTGTTVPEVDLPENVENWNVPGHDWTPQMEHDYQALSDAGMTNAELRPIFEHPNGPEARNLRSFFDWASEARSNIVDGARSHGETLTSSQIDEQMEHKLDAFRRFVGGSEAHDNVTHLPGAAEVPTEEVTLHVPRDEGFENTLQKQYDLTDAEAAQAYQAMRPALEEDFQARGAAAGMYEGPDGLRISKLGPLTVNAEASRALEDYLRTIGRSLEDETDERLRPAA